MANVSAAAEFSLLLIMLAEALSPSTACHHQIRLVPIALDSSVVCGLTL